MIILDGKAYADEIAESLKERISHLKYAPRLTVFSDTTIEANNTYTRQKEKRAKELGIDFNLVDISQMNDYEVFYQITSERLTSMIVQLPAPNITNLKRTMSFIMTDKDADGFNTRNIGDLIWCEEPSNYPCTPKGIINLLKHYNVPLVGKHAVVIGRSVDVGKPLALMLMNEDCTVTVCNSETPIDNLKKLCWNADIIISAVGKQNMVTADMVKLGAAVVDVGCNRVDGKLCGDVDYESVSTVAGWLTPVPGGVGPMTVISLMENVVNYAEKKQKLMSFAERKMF